MYTPFEALKRIRKGGPLASGPWLNAFQMANIAADALGMTPYDIIGLEEYPDNSLVIEYKKLSEMYLKLLEDHALLTVQHEIVVSELEVLKGRM